MALRRLSTPLLLLSLVSAALILIPSFLILSSSFDSDTEHNALWASGSVGHSGAAGVKEALRLEGAYGSNIDESVLGGGVIMGKLKNETAKAELGRASWKLLHTMAARLPETPTESEREAYKSFLYLFSRLYPCGECATEFQALLKKYPPQTSSRSAASFHLCHLHNIVNARLGKDEFDCSADLEGIYDCGCGDDPAESGVASIKSRDDEMNVSRDPVTGNPLVGG